MKAIKESNANFYGIRMIRKYFNPEEVKNLITAVYYSKLYYGAEIWNTPCLSLTLNKNLKSALANALKLCPQGITILNTHTLIHNLARRAIPVNVCLYRHAIMTYKLMKCELCEDEFVQLNFQLVDNPRQTKLNFIKTKDLTWEIFFAK